MKHHNKLDLSFVGMCVRYVSFDRNVQDPRALATIFAEAEAALADRKHPDPYRRKFQYCFAASLSLTFRLRSP